MTGMLIPWVKRAVGKSPPMGPLTGWRVGMTAERRANLQADALERRGAEVVHGCTMRTLDLSDDDLGPDGAP